MFTPQSKPSGKVQEDSTKGSSSMRSSSGGGSSKIKAPGVKLTAPEQNDKTGKKSKKKSANCCE